jgi:hypothetical protein
MSIFTQMKENREKAEKMKADCKIVLDFLVKISNSALSISYNDIAHNKFEEVYGPFFLEYGIDGYNMLDRDIKKRNDANALDFWLKYSMLKNLMDNN